MHPHEHTTAINTAKYGCMVSAGRRRVSKGGSRNTTSYYCFVVVLLESPCFLLSFNRRVERHMTHPRERKATDLKKTWHYKVWKFAVGATGRAKLSQSLLRATQTITWTKRNSDGYVGTPMSVMISESSVIK